MKRSGLRIRTFNKWDPRTFSYKNKFGAALLHNRDFEVSPILEIKDQVDTDFCVNFALASIREDTEGVIIAPEYGAAKTKQIEGDFMSYGADPDDAIKAAITYGSLERNVCPFTVIDKDRDFLANWTNYPQYLDDAAKIHRAGSFFKVNGWSDFFDSCRGIMQTQNVSILTGVYWQPEWDTAPGGVISEYTPLEKINPHAIKIRGQKTISGKLYLVIQNSYGPKFGDGGLYYFPRSVVNQFIFGRCILDLDPNEVKKETWNLLQRLADVLIKFLQNLKNSRQTTLNQ
jgi:hypothetical protein